MTSPSQPQELRANAANRQALTLMGRPLDMGRGKSATGCYRDCDGVGPRDGPQRGDTVPSPEGARTSLHFLIPSILFGRQRLLGFEKQIEAEVP